MNEDEAARFLISFIQLVARDEIIKYLKTTKNKRKKKNGKHKSCRQGKILIYRKV